ncbi:MAG: CBS domain-containing protein [Candidatus Heimdallarchaeaceae archaeon]
MKSLFDKQKFEMAVKEIMTKNVITVKPSASAETCAKLMIDNRIGSVVVINDKGVTLGIITKENLIESVIAAEVSAKDVTAEEAMSSPLITASGSTTIIQAMQTMFKEGIRHLVITGKDGKLQGICTDTDIFKVIPQLILLEQEYLRILNENDEAVVPEELAGYCDECNEYSDNLKYYQGLYLCPSCAPEEMMEINE